MKHRLWNRFRAWIGGHFWLACPLCGEMFGGHETVGSLLSSPYSGVCVCPDCTFEAGRINTIRMKTNDFTRT